MILAGDIGATNARLALFSCKRDTPEMAAHKVYPSRSFEEFDEILLQFLRDCPASIRGSCLGIAGPVQDGRCITTNLPWNLDAGVLAKQFPIGPVALINDLVANAHGIGALSPDDLLTVNEGIDNPRANRAVIAAGTGLGEAGILWDGHRHIPFATEGGHCDFGACTEQQFALARYLQKALGHVSYETVLCGDGLAYIYDFILDSQSIREPDWMRQRCDEMGKAAAISTTAARGELAATSEALDLFLEIYGQEAGNLALKTLARGGVFLGGGIAAKLATAIRESAVFLRGFRNKDKMAHLMTDIPIRVILNPDTALLGAARVASRIHP